MIHGCPFVSASLFLAEAPREAKINFLVDTGADQTCLMPADAQAMRLDFAALNDPVAARGIGGRVKVHQRTGAITFLERGVGLVVYDVSVYIYPDRVPYRDYPSILGRDVLNSWRIQYSRPENILTAEAIRHDLLVPMPISPDRPA